MDAIRYYLANALTATGIAGFLLGGQWVWLGASTILLILLGDLIAGRDERPRRIPASALADLPLYLHVGLMLGVYLAMAWRVGQGFPGQGGWYGATAVPGAIITLGWLSAIPNVPVAHELGHRHGALAQLLADVMAIFFGDPSRWVSHNLGHHLKVGTVEDSDTPQRGENVYRFVWRASRGALHEALTAERLRLSRRGYGPWSPRNRLLRGLAIGAPLLLLLGLVGGPLAVALALAGIALAKVIVEGLNYLQHYGLLREVGQPYARRHAWNHLWTFTRAAAVEITTHSQHHEDSDVTLTDLQPCVDAPQMPGAALCFLCAAVPPLWERYIAMPRLRDWDLRLASPGERELARAANRAAGWPDWLADMPPAPGTA